MGLSMTKFFQTLMLLELLVLPPFEVHDHTILVASFAGESPKVCRGMSQGLLLRGLWWGLDQGMLRCSVWRTLIPIIQVLRGQIF